MAITEFETTITAAPVAPEIGTPEAEFQTEANAFVAWLKPFSEIMELLRVYINSLGSEITTEINGQLADAQTAINTTVSEGQAAVQDDITNAAAGAVTAVNNAVLGTIVYLPESGSYTFPASITAPHLFHLLPTGADMKTNPATLDYSGHNFDGEATTGTDNFNTNTGIKLFYVDAAIGLRVEL